MGAQRWLYYTLATWVIGVQVVASPLAPVDLRVNLLPQRNAAGITGAPRLSWSLSGIRRGDAQSCAQVVACIVSPPAPCRKFFDSGVVATTSQFVVLPPVPAHSKIAWNVTIASALDGASASASATFVSGITDAYNATSFSPGAWAGAQWLQSLPSAVRRSRIRRVFNTSLRVLQAIVTLAHTGNAVAYLNGASVADDEWRCRMQVDVVWCSTTRELSADAFVAPGALNVFAFAASQSSAGLDDRFKLRLTLWLEDGSISEVLSDDPAHFSAGCSSELYMGQEGMNALSFTFEQGFEAAQTGWAAPAFNETQASLYDPTRAWVPCIAINSGGGDCAADVPESHTATLSCGASTITGVIFASFGTPQGTCGDFSIGACTAPSTLSVVQAACVGKSNCSIFVSVGTFGPDPCLGTAKHLDAQVTCSGPAPPPTPFDFPTRPNPVATRIVEVWPPASLTPVAPSPGSYVWSLEQNIAGSCAISIPASLPSPALKGAQIQFLFGERLYANNGSVWNMYGYQ